MPCADVHVKIQTELKEMINALRGAAAAFKEKMFETIYVGLKFKAILCTLVTDLL